MADVFDDEVDQTMTIDEYIEEIEAEELEADLVLGGDEGKDCTHSNGYMKRQAIFSCLTCVPAGNAGVCTACSLSCHDGHEVVELWTKRKFRCDCGNSKFGEFSCKLCPDKAPENTDNSYNHNFKGSYCTCGCPYPDPQAEEQAEMVQCVICEDWFHENHLGVASLKEIPKSEEGEPLYDELICLDCAQTCSFLRLYPATIWATVEQKNVEVNGNDERSLLEHSSSDNTYSEKIETEIHVSQSLEKCSDNHHESKSISNGNGSSYGENKNDKTCFTTSSARCILGVNTDTTLLPSEEKKPMFLSKIWRDLLCRCTTCSDFYMKVGVDYLIDKEDSLEEYEKMAKQKREEKLQQEEGAELNLLNGLDHSKKLEILSGIADMKNEFCSFLESFDSSKPITSADVQGIFENLAKNKKQRRL